MCLNKVMFSLNSTGTPYNNLCEPVGVGYKIMHEYNYLAIQDKGFVTAEYYRGVGWGLQKINDSYCKPYWPGFHIWTSINDAVGYFNLYHSDFSSLLFGPSKLVKVLYKKVIAFGLNETTVVPSDIKNYTDDAVVFKPCVIAHEMNIDSCLHSFDHTDTRCDIKTLKSIYEKNSLDYINPEE